MLRREKRETSDWRGALRSAQKLCCSQTNDNLIFSFIRPSKSCIKLWRYQAEAVSRSQAQYCTEYIDFLVRILQRISVWSENTCVVRRTDCRQGIGPLSLSCNFTSIEWEERTSGKNFRKTTMTNRK